MGHTLKKILVTALGVALVIMVAPNSKADVMTFDTSLISPPGVYFGTGNANNNFTTETNGTTELGLSVIQRYVGPIDPGAGSNVYDVTAGTAPPASSGATGPSWGVTFSINTHPGGAVLGDFKYALTVTDLTTGTILLLPFNPLLLPDNSYYGPGGETSTENGATYGVQNSEPFSILAGFDNNAPDEYQITLSELTRDGGLVERDTVFANAVPEPTSIFLFGTLAIGVLGLARRRLSGADPTI